MKVEKKLSIYCHIGLIRAGRHLSKGRQGFFMRRIPLIIFLAITAAALLSAPLDAQAPAEKPPVDSSQLKIDPVVQSFNDVKQLIDKGADVNLRDADGVTPLMQAAYFGDLKVSKLLVDKGADAKAVDNDGITVLMNAASSANLEIVKIVAGKGADVNARDKGGATALMYAALAPRDEIETSKYLIAKGADPAARDLQGSCAFSIARNRGKNELSKYLESFSGGENNVPKHLLYALIALVLALFLKMVLNRSNRGAAKKSVKKDEPASDAAPKPPEAPKPEKPPVDLLEAVVYQDLDTLKRGLAEGGDPNLTDKSGRSLLMAASANGFDAIVAALLEHKAEVNFQDATGRTALMNAAFSGSITTVRLLIGGGANVNLRDIEGRSAYLIASEKGNQKIMNFLKTAGSEDAKLAAQIAESVNAPEKKTDKVSEKTSVKKPDSEQDTGAALRACVSEGDLEGTIDLISKKADVNGADDKGSTALMIAAGAGRLDLMKALIEAKADVNAGNAKGVTPLIFAAAKGQAKAVILLVKAGANYNARTKNGISALKYATEKGFDDVAAVLKKVGAVE